MPIDYALDVVVFEYHLLMMAVALCWCPGFNGITHHNIDFYLFSLFRRKIEKLWVGLEETDVLLLLGLTPRKRWHFDPRFFSSLSKLFHGLVYKIMFWMLRIRSFSVFLLIVVDIYAEVHKERVFIFS